MNKRIIALIMAVLLAITTMVSPAVFAEADNENGVVIEVENAENYVEDKSADEVMVDIAEEELEMREGGFIEVMENAEVEYSILKEEEVQIELHADEELENGTLDEDQLEPEVEDETVDTLVAVEEEAANDDVESEDEGELQSEEGTHEDDENIEAVAETENKEVRNSDNEEVIEELLNEEVTAENEDESEPEEDEEAAVEPDENEDPEDSEEEAPVIVDEKEVSANWINAAAGLKGSLSGDWGKDILMVACSQVGYNENAVDYIVDANGIKRGKSVYGVIFDKPYQEWSAMFVSFCIKYARIDYWLFPTASLSNVLAGNIGYYGAYENDEDKYMPKPGDFVFFNTTGSGVSAERVGIVESAGNESVTVIEGDVGNSVCRRTYLRSDETIIGYGNIDKYMSVSLEKNAVKVAEEAAETEQPAEEVITEEETAEELTEEETVEEELTEEETVEEETVEEELTEEEPIEEEPIEEEPIEEELTEEKPVEEELTEEKPVEEELTEEEPIEEEPSEESVEFDPYKEELKLWVEEVSATEEMIERAEKAKSLDSIVYENGYFVYVRTGIALARFDRVDGIVYDIATGLPVAIYDEEAGIIYPLFDDEYAESENNVVSDEEIKYTENCKKEA